MTCRWTACSDVIDIQRDWSTELMCNALAREPWRNGKWMKMRLVSFRMAGIILSLLPVFHLLFMCDIAFCLSFQQLVYNLSFIFSSLVVSIAIFVVKGSLPLFQLIVICIVWFVFGMSVRSSMDGSKSLLWWNLVSFGNVILLIL